MVAQVGMFETELRHLEAKRLKERTEFDLEMMRELGTVPVLKTIHVTSIAANRVIGRSA
jgi:excinuclease UvrABC helicase subunit UvrB